MITKNGIKLHIVEISVSDNCEVLVMEGDQWQSKSSYGKGKIGCIYACYVEFKADRKAGIWWYGENPIALHRYNHAWTRRKVSVVEM
jgi:hypothetical protein